jgi:cytoskeletal protein CcmA (bactofilin family)
MKWLAVEPDEAYATETGPGVRMKGNLVTQKPLNIRGTFNGTIQGTFIRIERGAEVSASPLSALEVVVAGRFSGSIRASRYVLLMPGSSVSADISASMIQIMQGASFEGSVKMTAE